jgi:cytochrome c
MQPVISITTTQFRFGTLQLMGRSKMSGAKRFMIAACLSIATAYALDESPHLGQPISSEIVHAIDISIDSSGSNLPTGSGTAVQGAAVYAGKCVVCHGEGATGGENLADPLVGGIGTLATDKPVKTVVSYWPYATTLFDYTRRAMPLNEPMSLTDDEVYAVSAYILFQGGIIEETHELNAQSLPQVQMPNRDGFQSVWPDM